MQNEWEKFRLNVGCSQTQYGTFRLPKKNKLLCMHRKQFPFFL
jgi:hypothetical protein